MKSFLHICHFILNNPKSISYEKILHCFNTTYFFL